MAATPPSPACRAVRHVPALTVTLSALKAGGTLIGRLPPAPARTVAERAAIRLSRLPPRRGRPDRWAIRRGTVARHLKRVLGSDPGPRTLAGLVDQSIASYARYWVESLRLPRLTPASLTAGIAYEGFGPVDAALRAEKGVIFALPHLGGWEWAGAQLAGAGYKMSVVVERLEPPELFEWFSAFRERLGMQVIPAGPGATARCTQALAANHILCLLSDRLIAGSTGVEVDFFGERTELPAGPATLALRTGAALFPAAVYFDEGTDAHRTDAHRGVVLPAVPADRSARLRDDVVRMTQELTHGFERLISAAPEQWHLMQPNWPSDPGYPAR